MAEFWSSMSTLSQVYFVIACTASVILLIQFVLVLIGFAGGDLGDIDMAVDADVDAGGLEAGLFTIKGLVALFAIGGWVGLGMDISNVHIAVTIIVSVLCGAVAFVGVGFLYRAINKMQSSGNIIVSNSVGTTGEVYLTIPANERGNGKVSLILQERCVELEARTKSETPIPTGSMVKVVEVIGNIVIVDPIANSKEN